MADHPAEAFLSKTAPVNCMFGRLHKKQTVISEVVAFRAIWEDEERAFEVDFEIGWGSENYVDLHKMEKRPNVELT